MHQITNWTQTSEAETHRRQKVKPSTVFDSNLILEHTGFLLQTSSALTFAAFGMKIEPCPNFSLGVVLQQWTSSVGETSSSYVGMKRENSDLTFHNISTVSVQLFGEGFSIRITDQDGRAVLYFNPADPL